MSIEEHAEKYKEDAWKQYSLGELCAWVDNLVKRSGHRSNPDKKAKDLDDAQNYLDMVKTDLDKFVGKMQENIDNARGA